MELLILLGFWAALALIPAYVAKGKGRSFGGFWLYGLLLWPVAIIHAVIMKPERGSEHAESYERVTDGRRCPFCAETIKREAIVCKHCGRDVAPPPAVSSPVQSPRPRRDDDPAPYTFQILPPRR